MVAEETSLMVQSAKAEENRDRTIACKDAIQANFIVLAKLFKDSRDCSLWKLLDYESFEGYLGSPEIGFSRSKVYDLIRIYELYVDKLGMSPDDVIKFDHSKLTLIAPVVESDKDGWLGKARHLSKADLHIELGRVPGKSISPPTPASVHSPGRDDMTCINGCGPGEKSHFPVTRGAGGKEVEDWWVPMCRVCHYAFHANPSDFTWMYKRAWAKYLYGLISRGE
jgi:hypothetical protein